MELLKIKNTYYFPLINLCLEYIYSSYFRVYANIHIYVYIHLWTHDWIIFIYCETWSQLHNHFSRHYSLLILTATLLTYAHTCLCMHMCLCTNGFCAHAHADASALHVIECFAYKVLPPSKQFYLVHSLFYSLNGMFIPFRAFAAPFFKSAAIYTDFFAFPFDFAV